jgi:hypothetical protein
MKDVCIVKSNSNITHRVQASTQASLRFGCRAVAGTGMRVSFGFPLWKLRFRIFAAIHAGVRCVLGIRSHSLSAVNISRVVVVTAHVVSGILTGPNTIQHRIGIANLQRYRRSPSHDTEDWAKNDLVETAGVDSHTAYGYPLLALHRPSPALWPRHGQKHPRRALGVGRESNLQQRPPPQIAKQQVRPAVFLAICGAAVSSRRFRRLCAAPSARH